jgi:hypothetical protein
VINTKILYRKLLLAQEEAQPRCALLTIGGSVEIHHPADERKKGAKTVSWTINFQSSGISGGEVDSSISA